MNACLQFLNTSICNPIPRSFGLGGRDRKAQEGSGMKRVPPPQEFDFGFHLNLFAASYKQLLFIDNNVQ